MRGMGMGKGSVLIVDDEPTARKVLSAILEADFFQVHQASGVEQAIALVDGGEFVVDAIITDMKMPGRSGHDLFHHVKEHHSEIPVIFLTAYGTIETAVNAIIDGAYHFFVKPPDYQRLKNVLADAIEHCHLKRTAPQLRPGPEDGIESLRILGETPEMQRIYETLYEIRNSSCSVLICGEPGTGSELIAHSLHYSGNRSQRPFVSVNCAAITTDLFAFRMFGDDKGVFAGKTHRRSDLIEAVAGGTLFLDEIGDLDASAQALLLRVFQEGGFARSGGQNGKESGFRLVASTKRNLRQEVAKGIFREDLFYQVNVVCINLPPLRERKKDILRLTRFFMNDFCTREGKELSLDASALKALQTYSWPGNAYELKNVLEGVVVLAGKGKIAADDLPAEISASAESSRPPHGALKTLREVQTDAVRHALSVCNGNKSRAAQLLGVSRKTLYKRLEDAGPGLNDL